MRDAEECAAAAGSVDQLHVFWETQERSASMSGWGMSRSEYSGVFTVRLD